MNRAKRGGYAALIEAAYRAVPETLYRPRHGHGNERSGLAAGAAVSAFITR